MLIEARSVKTPTTKGLTLVVSVEALTCLDLLIWLRTGAEAAKRHSITQSTVSRNVRHVSEVFRITPKKLDGEREILGDLSLLNLERRVHQEYRWRYDLPLRIEAQHYSGPFFFEPIPDGWVAGNFDYLECHTPLHHLRQCVIDGWLTAYPDVPEQDDPELTCFHLTRMPTHFVVQEGHPLIELGDGITMDDIRRYPPLKLPENAFPKVQAMLQELGLWNHKTWLHSFDTSKSHHWEPEDLEVGYATVLTIRFYPKPQVILPLRLPLTAGDTLVIRREYANHPRLHHLLDMLRCKAEELAKQYPDVTIPAS